MRILVCSVVLCVWAAIPATLRSETLGAPYPQGKIAATNVTKFGAVWRSAIIPGWGQWYRGDLWWGAAYLGADALAAALSLAYGAQGDANYSAYKSATSAGQATSAYNDTQSADQLWATFSYAAAAIYGVNLLDAIFLTKSSPRQAGLGTPAFNGLAITAEPDHQGTMFVKFRWVI